MKVYIVFHLDYDSRDVEEVFDSKEKAENFIKAQAAHDKNEYAQMWTRGRERLSKRDDVNYNEWVQNEIKVYDSLVQQAEGMGLEHYQVRYAIEEFQVI